MSNDNKVILAKEDSFLIEIWVWYVIGVITIFTRLGVRLRTVGWRSLAGDDYFALFSLAMYTADAFLVHICYHAGTNVDVPAALEPGLSDIEVARIVYGSKAQLAAWYTYTALIWCMKFMVLFFYKRLLAGTFQARLIRHFFWVCGATYIAVFLTITLGCHPFQANWQVRPLPSRQCTFKPQNFYVGAVLNVLTDAILLSLPVPMLWGLKVRLSKKIAVGALLSSGLFVIAAAIVRAVLTLGSTPSGLNINRWGVRETIVGILTVNMPILAPMFQKKFWISGTYDRSYDVTEPTKNKSGRYGLGTFELRSRATSSKVDKEVDLEIASQSSQENIIQKVGSHEVEHGMHNVKVQTSIQIQSHQRDEESLEERMGERAMVGYNSKITSRGNEY